LVDATNDDADDDDDDADGATGGGRIIPSRFMPALVPAATSVARPLSLDGGDASVRDDDEDDDDADVGGVTAFARDFPSAARAAAVNAGMFGFVSVRLMR